MTTVPACHRLVAALSNIYTMMTRDRRLEAEPSDDPVLARLGMLQKLPLTGDLYAGVCDQLFELSLLDRAHVSAYQANKDDPVWIAERMRMLAFAVPDDVEPAHMGISYRLVFVVPTALNGEVTNQKMRMAQTYMSNTLERLRARYPRIKGRLFRLVCGEPLLHVVRTKADTSDLSTEVWFVDELQIDPTAHSDVPLHCDYATMAAEHAARIPRPMRNVARDDPIKLDVLAPTDIIARWHSFALGQIVCVERREKHDYGRTYNLRFVRVIN